MLTFAAMALAVPVGLALLVLLASGQRGQGGYGRPGRRVRIGPGLPVLLTLAALRRLDTVVLAAATVVVLIAAVFNARA